MAKKVLTIVIWALLGMSGSASLFREWASIFMPGRFSSSAMFSASLLTCFVGSTLGVLYLQHQKNRDLERRLSPRLMIGKLIRRGFPDPSSPIAVEYYFEVRNLSEGASLENVSVRLTGISPRVLEYLPVPLNIKHDNPLDPRSFATEFSLAPLATRHVDLLTGPITAAFPVPFMIEHTVVDVKVPLQPAKYRLTVEASARDTPPVEAFFEAWIDESGSLQCIQL